MTPREIYTLFKNKDGSEAIAGIATLEAVVSLVKEDNPKTVLELGGGLGTISYAILKNSNATLDIYEHNEYCRNELKKNLKGVEDRYTIITDYVYLPPKREYDLIVVDGGKGSGKYQGTGYPQLIAAYLQSLSSIKTIFIEGQRKSQKYWILEALHSRYIYKPTKYLDPLGGNKIGVRIDCKPSGGSKLGRFLFEVNHILRRNSVY